MQQPARHEGKGAGNKKAEHVDAKHIGFMRFDIVAACRPNRNDGADHDVQAQQVNETEMAKESRPDLRRHE